MDSLANQTLEQWHAAERALEDLPELSPDHESVVLLVVQLRAIHRRLTTARGLSNDVQSYCRGAIAASRELLTRVRSERRVAV